MARESVNFRIRAFNRPIVRRTRRVTNYTDIYWSSHLIVNDKFTPLTVFDVTDGNLNSDDSILCTL